MNIANKDKVIYLVILFLASSALASDNDYKYETTPEAYPFWIQGHPINVTTPAGEAQGQFYFRFIRDHSKIFSVGSVLYQRLPIAAQESTDEFVSKVTENLHTGLKISSWRRKLVRNTIAWEANWGEGHQYIRLYIKRNAKDIEYAMAIFRDTYAERTGFESEIIQLELMGIIPNGLKTNKNRTAAILKSIFNNEAEAQTQTPNVSGYTIQVPPGLRLPPIDPGTLPGGLTPGALIPTTTGGTINTKVSGNVGVQLSGNVGVQVTAPTSYTLNVPQLSAVSAGVNNMVASVDKVNGTLSTKLGSANTNLANLVAQTARANDLIVKGEQFVSDSFKGGNLIKDAFLTGAGGALGVAAIDGAVAGAGRLVAAIASKIMPKDITETSANVARIQAALDQYRNFGDEVIDYTRMVDAAASLLENQKTFLTSTFKTDNIEYALLILKDKLAQKNDAIEESRKNNGDESERYNLMRDADNMERVISLLKNSGNFCSSLNQLFIQMEKAEDRIQDLTVQTLNDITTYYKDKKHFNEYILSLAKKENSDASLRKEADAHRQLLATDDKAGLDQFKDHYAHLMNDCEKTLNDYRKKQSPSVSKDSVKAACTQYFSKVGEVAGEPNGKELFNSAELYKGVQVPGFSADNLKAANMDLSMKYNFSNSVFDIYKEQMAAREKPQAFGSQQTDQRASPGELKHSGTTAKNDTHSDDAHYFNALVRTQGSFGVDVATMKKEDERRSVIITQMRSNQAAITLNDDEHTVVGYEDPKLQNLKEMIESGNAKAQDACRQLNTQTAPTLGAPSDSEK